ncbi:hypothetical protein OEZ86_008436 [Tetradesmus obliquus]|nr:hypothetical protein OEZ86_008436 [Tetradesmus obliquus]
MNRLAVCLLLLAVVVAAEEEQIVNERKLQGLLLPLAAKAVAVKAIAAKAAVAGAVVSQGAAALAAAAPQVSVQEAPCQQVCHDKCSVVMEKECKKVPVTKKECAMVPKTVSEKRCSKNCQVSLPGHGRKMKGLLLPLAAKAVVAKAVVAKAAVAGAVVAKAAAMVPSVDCEVVCEDVPVTVHELQCKDVTSEVEQCVNMPKQSCEKVCLCVPMKQVTVTMGHPLMAGA